MLKIFYAIFCLLSFFNGAWMLSSPLSWYTYLPASVPHTGPFKPPLRPRHRRRLPRGGSRLRLVCAASRALPHGTHRPDGFFRGARPDPLGRDSGGAVAEHPLAD